MMVVWPSAADVTTPSASTVAIFGSPESHFGFRDDRFPFPSLISARSCIFVPAGPTSVMRLGETVSDETSMTSTTALDVSVLKGRGHDRAPGRERANESVRVDRRDLRLVDGPDRGQPGQRIAFLVGDLVFERLGATGSVEGHLGGRDAEVGGLGAACRGGQHGQRKDDGLPGEAHEAFFHRGDSSARRRQSRGQRLALHPLRDELGAVLPRRRMRAVPRGTRDQGGETRRLWSREAARAHAEERT